MQFEVQYSRQPWAATFNSDSVKSVVKKNSFARWLLGRVCKYKKAPRLPQQPAATHPAVQARGELLFVHETGKSLLVELYFRHLTDQLCRSNPFRAQHWGMAASARNQTNSSRKKAPVLKFGECLHSTQLSASAAA